ncbi:hypothetical protein LTR39_004389 [Cryomyces antarcticus]|nr:hypothetical protein LTR39_004389 [Cryomyces antarcticus]
MFTQPGGTVTSTATATSTITETALGATTTSTNGYYGTRHDEHGVELYGYGIGSKGQDH